VVANAQGGLPPGSAGVMAQQPTHGQQADHARRDVGKAQQLAQQILAMPEAQKDSELIQLKKR
jgi:hypothetical protein